MLKIPESVITGFSSFLNKKNIPVISHNYYLKWLKYYLDYCHKYRFNYLNPGNLPNFLNKLKEKKQTGIQQKQAHESIGLFCELIKQKPDLKDMLGFVIQKNNEVKNKEKPRSYGKDHSEVKVEVKDKVKELTGQANLTLSKGVTKKVPDVQFKKPEMNKEETHCSWQNIFTGLNNEIKVRHYSPKTLKSYTIWARKFQGFTKSKNPEALSPSNVKEFLSF